MRRKWTELQGEEYNLLSRYLSEMATQYIHTEPSRRVGKGVEPPEGTPEEYAKAVRNSSRLKIDCVGWTTELECDIIEVKERARAGTIGQLQLYQLLLQEETGVKATLVIVCETIHPDVKKFADSSGIRVYEFPPA